MTTGYIEFEFDLPGALLERLIVVFDSLTPEPLSADNVGKIPEEQGVYQLFLRQSGQEKLVYIGKTDAAAGLRIRLSRHAKKIQSRVNLDPAAVLFKAVRVFVFTAVDLETQLIKHYGNISKVSWNGSGFGSNDVGKERDTTKYKQDHFDALFPIDTNTPLAFNVPTTGSALEILQTLKTKLPYNIRFERPTQKTTLKNTDDLAETMITLATSVGITTENIIRQIISKLPLGWHATKLPSHIIVYKNDDRKFPSGTLIAKS